MARRAAISSAIPAGYTSPAPMCLHIVWDRSSEPQAPASPCASLGIWCTANIGASLHPWQAHRLRVQALATCRTALPPSPILGRVAGTVHVAQIILVRDHSGGSPELSTSHRSSSSETTPAWKRFQYQPLRTK